jgi:hypothetical protein
MNKRIIWGRKAKGNGILGNYDKYKIEKIQQIPK